MGWAGLALVAIALTAGCDTATSMEKNMAPMSSAVDVEPARMTATAMAVTWADWVNPPYQQQDWQLSPCDSPNLLCIYRDDELMGTMELGVYPVEGSDLQTWMTEAGVPFAAATDTLSPTLSVLNRWVENYYGAIAHDRQVGMGSDVLSQAPKTVQIGTLYGVRYEFETVNSQGENLDHTVGYVTTDGLRLYVLSLVIMPDDRPSQDGEQWMTESAFQEFESILEPFLATLSLGES